MNIRLALLSAAVLFAMASLAAAAKPCAVAVIWRDGIVTIDWACVDATAATLAPPANNNSTAAWAYKLKAVRAGNAPDTIDWASVDKLAAQWSPEKKADAATAWAYSLKSVREGKALPDATARP